MSMDNFKYNEYEYVKYILENGITSKYIFTELRLLATFYKQIYEYKPARIKEELYKFCEQHIPNFNKVKFFATINKAVYAGYKKEAKLITVTSVSVTDSELKYINQLDIDEQSKQVLFTLLIIFKLSKAVYEQRHIGEVYSDTRFKYSTENYNRLKRLSNIPKNVNINNVIYDLNTKSILIVMYGGMFDMTFIKDIPVGENIAIKISDYENLGYQYKRLCGDNKVLDCSVCGKIFYKRSNKAKFCSEECHTKDHNANRKNRNR